SSPRSTTDPARAPASDRPLARTPADRVRRHPRGGPVRPAPPARTRLAGRAPRRTRASRPRRHRPRRAPCGARRRPGGGRMKTNPTRALAIAAGLVIVALTAAAFWLSYAHLAEVALAHGMEKKEIRAWAWPATLDLFIVAGELLMLRAALQGRVDWWAIGLTVAGSGSSIALNVAGVGSHAEPLDYVVAAVPPTAALLAFGALMRQIHQALAARADAPAVAAEATVERVDDDQERRALEAARPLPEVVPAGVRLLPLVARSRTGEVTAGGPLLRTYSDRVIDRYAPAAQPGKVAIPPLDEGVFWSPTKGS